MLTKEYTGKAPKDWEYYENGVPVTKHYYFNQVGNMKLGVLLTEEELSSIPKNKRGEIHKPSNFDLCVDDEGYYIMEVCECSGYTDEQREYFTEHIEELLGSVIEVKANGGTATLTLEVVIKDDTTTTVKNVAKIDDKEIPETPETTVANIKGTKSVDKTTAKVGDTLTYTITLTNNGNADEIGRAHV